jgi:hypothetical protein
LRLKLVFRKHWRLCVLCVTNDFANAASCAFEKKKQQRALRLRRIQIIEPLLDVRHGLLGGDLSLLVPMWLEDLLCWTHLLQDAADE